jgi:hypothetical protein
MSHTRPLLSILLALSLTACAASNRQAKQNDDRILGTPPPRELEYIPDREPIVLVVYDISEEDEAALEAELAEANAQPQEEVTTTTTTVVKEELPSYQTITSPSGNVIPWSGGPVPEGYEGPISDPQ